MPAEITTLQLLVARLYDRTQKLRSADPTLSKDLDLLNVHLQQQAAALDRAHADIRMLAGALLAFDVLASRTQGVVMTEATRKVLEQMVLETNQTGGAFPV